MLSHRLLLGPIFIAIIAGLLWLDQAVERVAPPDALSAFAVDGHLPGGLIVLLAIAVICALAASEIARFSPVQSRAVTVSVVFVSIIGLLSPLCPEPLAAISLAGVLATLSAVAAHTRKQSAEHALTTMGITLFAFVYLGILPAAFVLIRAEHTAWTLLAVILTIKSCDIGAYFTGRAIGSHKLIPWLSPGKTWEGLVGGMVFAAGIGALLVSTLGRSDGLSPLDGAILGGVLGVVGQAGDLVASFLKRGAGVKNSGGVPGFGGVLDLADSTMLTAPVALALLNIL